MNDMFETLTSINDTINTIVWVKIGLVLLLGVGILMTIITGCFQIRHIGLWMKKTIGGVFKKIGDGGTEAGESPELNGDIELGSFSRLGCPYCKKKHLYVCPHCGNFICYDGHVVIYAIAL